MSNNNNINKEVYGHRYKVTIIYTLRTQQNVNITKTIL